MNEICDFERYMRNVRKKEKEIEDQKIIDEMLSELKKKNEQQHHCNLTKAKKHLESLIQAGG
jgi:hypothetical protein